MAQQDERNYAAAMTTVYNWLREYSIGHEWFSFNTLDGGDYIFQGRGDGVLPKPSFYVELLKREAGYAYVCLDFLLSDDFQDIRRINLHMGWSLRKGGIYQDYRDLAASLGYDVQNKTSQTENVAGALELDQMKSRLFDWLTERENIFSAVGQAHRFQRPDGHPVQVDSLVDRGVLEEADDGNLRIVTTFEYPLENRNEVPVNEVDMPANPPLGEPLAEVPQARESEVTHTNVGVVSHPVNCIVFGAPGTGKSYKVEEERKKTFGENCERVTFYPTYSYAQFVGTYKPVMKAKVGGGEEIAYEFVPGPFLRVLVKALNEAADADGKKKNWCLIIEEINRANAAAVFGDVFQLLDRNADGVSEYSVAATEDVKRYLAKELSDAGKAALAALSGSVDRLMIPANMYLWATMNSADQGVFPMDTAFKRRWEFEYIGIDAAKDKCDGWQVKGGGKSYNWNDVRVIFNGLLSLNGVNEDKLMGPFFVKAENNLVSEKQFESKVLMYLWEDAARMCRGKLFGPIKTYSALVAEWRAKGPKMFKDLVKEGSPAYDIMDIKNAWGKLFPVPEDSDPNG